MVSRVDIELYINYTRRKGLYGGLAQNQLSIIWKKEISNTRKLRKSSELQVRIKLTTLQVLVRML